MSTTSRFYKYGKHGRKTWSAASVAQSNPQGYWREIQGAFGALVQIEFRDPPRGMDPPRLSVVMGLAQWRDASGRLGTPREERKWRKVLLAATEAACRGGGSVSRSLQDAVNCDRLWLRPALAEAGGGWLDGVAEAEVDRG
jgi:hypothetical protein